MGRGADTWSCMVGRATRAAGSNQSPRTSAVRCDHNWYHLRLWTRSTNRAALQVPRAREALSGLEMRE